MNDEFSKRLEELGFFRYVAECDRKMAIARANEVGWAGIYGESGRLFLADAEDLAEGGVGQFIRSLSPFLLNEGVGVQQIEDHLGDDSYFVTINGKRYTMFTDDEAAMEDTQPGLTWGLTAARSFQIVNELLAAVDSNERLYAVNGGNDLFAFFLTSALYDWIHRHPDATPRDAPYMLNENYPLFGQLQER